MNHSFQIEPGERLPAGSRAREGGVNFSVFSRWATRVWLQLYENVDASEPFYTVELDPSVHRTFFFWHVFVAGATPGIYYTWRADGPTNTRETGARFDPGIELLDPWAVDVDARHWDRRRALKGNSGGIRARVLPPDTYDWQGDIPLRRSLAGSIIYELHVGGYTRDASAGTSAPGTFRGLIEKIPHLQALGVTDVELLPVMAFDDQDVPAGVAALGLRNFWGYSPYGFFAPHPGYASEAGNARDEFRDLVKALHQAGIGVILDVVFNHTAEGGAGGPVINFKGLANEIFYHLDPADRRHYRDYTGCGNTVQCNHPLVARFILDCLKYWVKEMHVDGFRFDLASVMARGEHGEPLAHAPVIWNIEFATTLRSTHLIAEAWDAAGLYQLGEFPGYRWAEWNGDYRDVVRRFLSGEPGITARLASRIAGSSDLYLEAGRLPINSINFVTCHDGFTLNDLVSYKDKHNEDNGENNRDGTDSNHSFNCGAEGPSENRAVTSLRQRQVRNVLTILMMSQGVPMLLAGDEMLNTQRGNNNAWCQDNPTGWLDWSLAEQNEAMLRFTRELIALRRRHPSLSRERFLTGEITAETGGIADITWHGRELNEPEFDDPDSRVLAFTLAGFAPGEPHLHVVLNGGDEALSLALPQLRGRSWYQAIDTSRASPDDIQPAELQPAASGLQLVVPERTVMVFEAR